MRPFLFCVAMLACASLTACGTAGQPDLRQEDLDASLIAAARTGNSHDFKLALDMGGNLRAREASGTNAVLAAAEGRRGDMLRTLLERGVDPDARGASGFTPLGYAAMMGRVGDMRALLKAGASLNAHNALGEAPLHLAAEFGRLEAIALLAAAGAKIDDLSDAGETPLLAAIRGRRAESLRRLLDLGADPNAVQRSGANAGAGAVLLASMADREDMALALLRGGARAVGNAGGYTSLQMARFMNQPALERALLDRGMTE